MRKLRTNTIALFALFFTVEIPSPAYARSNDEIIRGQVVRVVDGDALPVVVDTSR
jgi:hypothetical protein